jgi:hypothetical protein
MPHPLRLLIYDATCRDRPKPVGLSHVWRAGARLYDGLGRLDHARGVSSWGEALGWLADVDTPCPIVEIQFWGHGKWGRPLIDGVPLDRAALRPEHPLHGQLRAIRERLVPDGEALWWFRACETFGALAGHDFARAWSTFFGCRAAGHTYIIAFFQSGLHSLRPGEQPGWPVDEGLLRGTPQEPLEAHWSALRAPNTITCLHGVVPATY